MQIFAPNQWTEAADSHGWIRGKLEEWEQEGDPVGEKALSINLDPEVSQNTKPPTNQATYTSWYEAPHTYTAEDSWVWFQSEKVRLTLKRLAAPGDLEIWWDGAGVWWGC